MGKAKHNKYKCYLWKDTHGEIFPAMYDEFNNHYEKNPYATFGHNDTKSATESLSEYVTFSVADTDINLAITFDHIRKKLNVEFEGNKYAPLNFEFNKDGFTHKLKWEYISEAVFKKLLEVVSAGKIEREKVKANANKFSEVVVVNEPNLEDEPITATGSTLQEKYTSIVSNASAISTKINSEIALGDTKELAQAFLDTRDSLKGMADVAPSTAGGFLSRATDKIPFVKKVKKKTDRAMAENSSVQDNIDYLFGLIHKKYTKLVNVGTSLQQSKGKFINEISELKLLFEESNAELAQYENEADMPMQDVALNTQIASEISKNEAKLSKIDGAILSVRTTIIALGKNLPAHKADLEDEMALGGLLSSVDDYQQMYKEVTELVAGVTKATAENTHKVIENLIDIQLNDTHTIDYIKDSAKRDSAFGKMITTKHGLLDEKIRRDAVEIKNIINNQKVLTSGATAEQPRKAIKYREVPTNIHPEG